MSLKHRRVEKILEEDLRMSLNFGFSNNSPARSIALEYCGRKKNRSINYIIAICGTEIEAALNDSLNPVLFVTIITKTLYDII